jgi:arsenite methyltransferase
LDRWAAWLLNDRFGGDEAAFERALAVLQPIRDRVLDGAALTETDTLLDVGAGDGLVGSAALQRLGPQGRVVFSDVSRDLLMTCRQLAEQAGALDRCAFVDTAAEHLHGVDDASVDVVTTRSVLIYVVDKPAAFGAFARVLRRGGRISLFEPINRTMRRLNEDSLFGYDTRTIGELAGKVREVYDRMAPPDSAMLNFDAADLVQLAVDAGFESVAASVEITGETRSWLGPTSMDRLRTARPNPNALTLGEAIDEALDDSERRELERHLRPQVEAGSGRFFNVGCFMTGQLPDRPLIPPVARITRSASARHHDG